VCPELKTIRACVASLPLSFIKGKGEVRGIRLRRKKMWIQGGEVVSELVFQGAVVNLNSLGLCGIIGCEAS
jgi:hypothetical protein